MCRCNSSEAIVIETPQADSSGWNITATAILGMIPRSSLPLNRSNSDASPASRPIDRETGSDAYGSAESGHSPSGLILGPLHRPLSISVLSSRPLFIRLGLAGAGGFIPPSPLRPSSRREGRMARR